MKNHLILYAMLLLFAGVAAAQNPGDHPAGFANFYQRFEKNCEFQKAHVTLPLPCLVYDDDSQSYDTISYTEWKCVPEDTAGHFLTKFDNIKPNTWRVEYQVEDTGIRISHYFVLKDNEWYLYQIVDDSM